MQGKLALVTGGTRGIGAAISKALLASGCTVIVTARTKSSFDSFIIGIQDSHLNRVSFLACDFENETDVQALEEVVSLGTDILINNAGINSIALAAEIATADFVRIQRVNVEVPFRLSKAAVTGMAARKWGRIVNITSIFGLVSKSQRLSYSTSKFALNGMTRALALDYAEDNVLVNAVGPGVIETDLTHKILGNAGIAALTKNIPIGRLGTPEEIARLVIFLAIEDNTYLTGQQIIIDGGYTSA